MEKNIVRSWLGLLTESETETVITLGERRSDCILETCMGNVIRYQTAIVLTD